MFAAFALPSKLSKSTDYDVSAMGKALPPLDIVFDHNIYHMRSRRAEHFISKKLTATAWLVIARADARHAGPIV